jgi:uncharacterized hydrophobic protein (TIGR00271 family)
MSVLVIVSTAEEAGPLVRWGARFARARDTNLKVLHLSRGTKAADPRELPLRDPADQNPVRKAIRSAGCDHLVESLTVRFQREQTQKLRRMLLEAEQERLALEGTAPPAEGEVEGEEGAARSGERAAAPAAAQPDPEATETSASATTPQEDASAPAGALGSSSSARPPEGVDPGEAPDPSLASLQQESFLTIRSVSHVDPRAAALAEVRAAKASLLVVGKHERSPGEEEDLSEVLLRDAPCDTMLLRAQGVSGEQCRRVLVPAAGGPHSIVSLRLAGGLSASDQAVVTPLYVGADAGDPEEARELGTRQLEAALRAAGISPSQNGVLPQVKLAPSPLAGIGDAVKEVVPDLVLVGATQVGFVRRLLFGAVPDRLLSGPKGTAVAVMRAARPLSERALELIDAIVSRWLPQLDRADRVELFERLQDGSRFGVDFASLIMLSTGIASLGLMQDSAAVVIGAMLVAPLMTPMIGAGLALVQGNTVLVGEAARAIAKGLFLAIFVGVLSGFLGRFTGMLSTAELTDQLVARSAPTGLDLVVAYLSGLAAAYALARPNLSGALPGVAIAAALVPPLGTVGIALSAEAWHVASGAALLFGTNLVAIILGAATVFRAMGVHASRGPATGQVWSKRAVVGLSLALMVLTAWFVVHLPIWVARDGEEHVVLTDHLEEELRSLVEEDPERTLLFAGPARGEADLEVVVSVRGRAPDDGILAGDLSKRAERVLRRACEVRLVLIEAAVVQQAGG